MIVVDKYLGREFHWKTYNCWDLARDVWMDHCGVDIGARAPSAWTTRAMTAAFTEQRYEVEGIAVTRIEQPEDPCLVLFIRPNVLSHCGVYVRGKVLHLRPRGNVALEPIEQVARGFTELRWYK